jgi:hypothetical protein
VPETIDFDLDHGGTPLPEPAEEVVDGVRWRFTNMDSEWTAVGDGPEHELGVSVAPVWPKDSGPGTEQLDDGSWAEVEPERWVIQFAVYYPGGMYDPPEWDSVDWETRPSREEAMRDGWAEYQRREKEQREAEEAHMKQLEEDQRLADAYLAEHG